jgi:hypothetical protein
MNLQSVTVLLTACLLVGVMATASAAPQLQEVAARSADDFLNSVGVCMHIALTCINQHKMV